MQKVSKQSLAMIALSILLAISIALTFTFAALQDSKTANGKITFSGNVGLVFDNLDSGITENTTENSIEFTVTYDGTTFAPNITTAGVKLASTSGNADIKVTLTYGEVQSENLKKILSIKKATGFGDPTNNSVTTSTKWTASSGSVLVIDLLEWTDPDENTMTDLVAETQNMTFRLTFEASKATS